MDKSELAKILSEHKKWIDTNLTEGKQANLQDADLRGADLDYNCWPLWCGSFNVIVDKKIAAQLAYHFCRLICDDEEVKASQKALYPLANQFHRVEECGKLGEIENK